MALLIDNSVFCYEILTFNYSNLLKTLIFFHLASFRHGLPTNKQIYRLNQNSSVTQQERYYHRESQTQCHHQPTCYLFSTNKCHRQYC